MIERRNEKKKWRGIDRVRWIGPREMVKERVLTVFNREVDGYFNGRGRKMF